LPYLEGERSPIFDAKARGVFFGMTPVHTRGHFARAVFEGVSCALASILDIRREQMPIAQMRVIGGGANSVLWKQILADIGRVDIRGIGVSASVAAALGAAMAAGTGISMFDSIEEAAKLIVMTDTLTPNTANEEIYCRVVQQYQNLYPLLKPAFHERI